MYANVQALRAFAALWVAWYHTMQPVLNGAYGLHVNAGGLPLFHGVGEIGWMGVDVFFVISGFIMAYSTKDLGGGTRDAEKFMRKRIRRIVPLYWVLTTLVVAVAIALPDFFHTYRFDFMHALKSYFFLPAERPDGVALPPLVPGWSLNYEMYFYLVFTVAIWLGVHRRVYVFAAFFTLSVVAGQLLQYGNPWSPGTMRFVITSPLLLEFLAGVLIAPIAQRTQARAWICLALIAAGLWCLRYWVVDIPGEEQSPRYVVEAYRVAAIGTPAALLVLGFVLLEKVWKFPKLLVGLGDASYSIYLTHFFVPGFCAKLFVYAGWADAPAGLFVLFSMALIGVIGIAFYHFVERPLIGMFKPRVLMQTRLAGQE